MSDREAFVAAIAANPTDDLPRLVFADWLDEHGDPDRAEFIRTQIRWHHTFDADERKHLNARTADLFREHWQRWFGPMLNALDPHADIAHCYPYAGISTPESSATISARSGSERPVRSVLVERGFVRLLTVDVPHRRDLSSLAEAFRLEPTQHLTCHDALHSPVWNKFTEPALRRVTHLNVFQSWSWDVSAPDGNAFLNDPHLAGVREFSLFHMQSSMPPTPPLPPAFLRRFVRSPLAYRLSALDLYRINTAGVEMLCEPGRLRLQRLDLSGPLDRDAVRLLSRCELTGTLQKLKLIGTELTERDVAPLCLKAWPKLTDLHLTNNRLSSEVLRMLADAVFAPQLEELNLVHNPLFTGDKQDMGRLRMLSAALNPQRLRRVTLSNTGLSHVPDFLAERFGDRVVV